MDLKIFCAAAVICFGSINAIISDALASELDALTEKFAKQANLSGEKAKEEVDLFFRLLGEEMKSGKNIQVRNFGTFYLQKREAREGRNPKTGGKIQIPAKSYPRFRSSDNLKELVNSSDQEDVVIQSVN